MDEETILSQYHGLWQVEESFRISKQDLRLRPVLHCSGKRIRAHIANCSVAFSLIRFLEHRIKHKTGENFSAERIREELYRVQESIVRDITNQYKYVIPSKTSQEGLKLYDIMHKNRQVAPFKLTTGV
jgi:transposase